MTDEIRVHVVNYKRKSLYMRYTDPVTGKQVTKSTGTHRRKEAERLAHKWEADLNEGRYKAPSKVTWFEFRDRYEHEVVTALAERTAGKVSAVFNAVERHLNTHKLANLTADRISTLALGFGGAMTGEHGDGILRSCWLEKMVGPRLVAAMKRTSTSLSVTAPTGRKERFSRALRSEEHTSELQSH